MKICSRISGGILGPLFAISILNDSFECEYLNEKIHLESIGYSCLSEKFTDYVYSSDIKRAVVFLKKVLKKRIKRQNR